MRRSLSLSLSRRGMGIVIALALLSVLNGCGGGGGGSDGSGGSAPTISALSFSPAAVYVNAGNGSQSVFGSVDYSDPDGDITSLTVMVRDASGQVVDTSISPIEGVSGSRSGTIEGDFVVGTTVAGNFTAQVYLTDAKDHHSNHLEITFRVAEFPWVARQPMPTPRRDFATAMLDGRIYVIGGGDVMAGVVPAPPTEVVEIFDPATDSWASAPPMPTAVTNHVAAVVGGKIYVIGGEEPMTDTVQEYDPATQLWTLRANIPTGRAGAAAAVLEGRIFVIGGSAGGMDLSTVEAYDPVSDTWSARAPLAAPRRDLAAATVSGTLLALGGYTGTYVPDSGYRHEVEAYSSAANNWSPRANMLIARADFAAGVVGSELLVAGGGNVARALDDVSGYDPSTDAWRPRTPMPSTLAWPRAAAVNGKLYVFDTHETYEYSPENDIL